MADDAFLNDFTRDIPRGLHARADRVFMLRTL